MEGREWGWGEGRGRRVARGTADADERRRSRVRARRVWERWRGKRDAQGENGTIASRDDGFKREIGRFEDDVGTGERGERGGDVVDGGVADETAARVGRRRWGDERGVASSEGDDEGEVREGAERDAREREGELRDVKI